MNILSIDTALRSCSIGVMRDGDIVFHETQVMSRGQDQALALDVEKALQQAKVDIKNLSAIAVTTGPGSFTGIRVGMAFARGLVSVLNIPLIGLTTTEVLAHAIPEAQAVVIEIKKDAYIAQLFDEGVAQSDLTAFDQMGLKKFFAKKEISHIVTHSDNVASFLPIQSSVSMPEPTVMIELAQHIYQNADSKKTIVRPVYVREADVTVKN